MSVNITKDGVLNIVEIIDVTFTEKRRGIFRKIPLNYNIDGVRRNLTIEKASVADWKSKIYNEGGYRVIRIGDANTYIEGKQRYVIRYTVRNALTYHDDSTEFYWNIIGDEWEVPILEVDYTIRLPLDIKLTDDDVRLFSGPTGSTNSTATLDKDGSVLTGQSLAALRPGEAVTLALRLPQAYFQKPENYYEPGNVEEEVSGSPIRDFFWYGPAALIAMLIGFFSGKKKADPVVLETEDIYYPPGDLSPPAVGTFYDGQVNTEDIVSLIPYWGNQGFVRVKGLGEKGREMDIFFEKVRDLPGDYPEYHHVIFNKIFEDEDLVLLSVLKNKIYSAISKAGKLIKKDIRDRELYDREMLRTFHSGWMIGLFFLSVFVAIMIFIFTGWIKTGLAFIALGITAFVIHFLPKKRSEKGRRLQAYLKAFKAFLEDGAPSKVSELISADPKYFEKVFPFAVALGVDKSWTSKLAEMDYHAPHWYYYGTHPVPSKVKMSQFSDAFNVKEISSVFRSAPSSSGSSGSSGGFSGGGAGGGGGGSW